MRGKKYGEPPVDEDEGFAKGGRKRRRKGGIAGGMMARPRLDRSSRKPAGGGLPPPGGGLGDPLAGAPSGAPMISKGTPTGAPDEDIGLKRGGKLTAAERHALPSKDFALPGERYPINDVSHGRNALARVAQHGNSEEKERVRAAVHSKFPGISQSSD